MGIYSFYTGESNPCKKPQPNQQHNLLLSNKRDSYTVHGIRPFWKTLQHHLTLLQKSTNSKKTFFSASTAWILAKPYKIFSCKIIKVRWNRLHWWRTRVNENVKGITILEKNCSFPDSGYSYWFTCQFLVFAVKLLADNWFLQIYIYCIFPLFISTWTLTSVKSISLKKQQTLKDYH